MDKAFTIHTMATSFANMTAFSNEVHSLTESLIGAAKHAAAQRKEFEEQLASQWQVVQNVGMKRQ